MLIISKHKWRIDGLNNITYDLISITRTQLFVKMNVHIDMKRVRKVTYIFTQSHGKVGNIIGLSLFNIVNSTQYLMKYVDFIRLLAHIIKSSGS
jgi:hypothetical protein